ncbi:dihydroneopterin aldolase [Zoogloea dura]|jgi:dihydroneopterin aldolase|uniref:7,8-dihydroneopterin aldolase n=1 Tax=Zoogloea dura TaxID=2728840 RepID=A0A848G758_9RHOO|nr:dihydroneopterin aldolase [Zoogloea dura]NML28098.1 dihydroneopterin aldolase [Zoogloea dura]
MDHDCLIRLDGLCLQASIGIYAHEIAAPQPLEVDLRLAIDGTLAARSDDIRHTVDYDQVVDALEGLLAGRHFNLLEHLSQAMLDLLGQRFPLKRAEITLAKPLAVPKARRVSVTRSAEWKREAVKVVAL